VSNHSGNRRDRDPEAPAAPLSLEDTLAEKQRGLSPRRRSGASGYDPYDAAPTTGPAATAGATSDLRKLSEWIRLKRQIETLKKDGDE